MTNHNNETILERYIDSFSESKINSLNRRDILISEETFKLCEVIINADTGVLGAVGLSVIISQNIQPIVAGILGVNVILIIFVIYRAFDLRSRILSLRRDIMEKKSHTDEAIREQMIENYDELLNLSQEEFKLKFLEIKNSQKEQKPSVDEINIETTKLVLAVNQLRSLFIITLIAIVIAVIIQLLQTVFLQ